MSEKNQDLVTEDKLNDICLKAWNLMCTVRAMAGLYEEERKITGKYVHSTSRGHEAIQLATAFHLTPHDYASLYYRDESMLLGLGFTPYELMLQLMAKADDPFSGGRTYYNHPSVRRAGFPVIPHQSSATGMQAIPAAGMAHAIKYLQGQGLHTKKNSVVLCSIGDAAMTEGEVAEALQMAVLKSLPIIFLVQDNNWGISVRGSEMRAMSAFELGTGFKGLKKFQVEGWDFIKSWEKVGKAFKYARTKQAPVLIHAECPLIGHHTSGVRKEWYRDEENMAYHIKYDPYDVLREDLLGMGMEEGELNSLEEKAITGVKSDFKKAVAADDPLPADFDTHEFAESPVAGETGVRQPEGAGEVLMVDAAVHAIDEILTAHPEALVYGEDVGFRLGGVFREAATLAKKHGNERVFNTPIQEAYIIGSTVGMSAVGARPIVEIQFADYIWPGINQLVTELSKSCYLSKGKFPVQALIRIPTGAYGGGGPYHSGSVESTLLNIRGIKVVYPSNAADMKGLMKAAFYDPNPVVMLEHKGLYWSKMEGTETAKTIEPDGDYRVPLGKGKIVKAAGEENIRKGQSLTIITWGMGVHWALNVEQSLQDHVEIIDLRTLNPLDWPLIQQRIEIHNHAMIVTEEPLQNSFAESLAGRIATNCFSLLDEPVALVGAANLPAIPLNRALEQMMLPNAEKVSNKVREVLGLQ
ncbi:MAG: thiamine pyrophosphate-dependent enzyme [Cyclobacteriaceae bacterium]|nr:thiamine pyrophosphate-dependent enzyme [Cyclobacteriaceae bacterium]